MVARLPKSHNLRVDFKLFNNFGGDIHIYLNICSIRPYLHMRALVHPVLACMMEHRNVAQTAQNLANYIDFNLCHKIDLKMHVHQNLNLLQI